MLLADDLEMGHARALLPLEAAQQILSANEVVGRKLTVRDTEKLVAKAQNNGRQAPLLRVKRDTPRDIVRLKEQLADALAAAVGLDMADWWTPTAGSYLAQVPKARIVEAVTEAVSIEKAAPLAKLKKGEAVAAAEALLQGTRWLPSPLRARWPATA